MQRGTEPPARTLLVEGWRGINHSYALANQYQLLELMKLPGLRLRHTDLPFAFPHWSRATHHPGLPDADMALIDALPPPADEPVDCVFRICSPFRTGPHDDRRRTVTFMITELGLTPGSFVVGAEREAFTRGTNRIVTSTTWSRDRIAEWGFSPERIDVVPLGVDAAAFYPVTAAERAASRTALGIADDETVLLNVGIPAWNKGIDVLLRAYAKLRRGGRKLRLIVKDQRDVYGVTLDQVIRNLGPSCPELLDASSLGAISLVTAGMGRDRLRLLYGVADAYVSPYRAEGFNLPVLEAIACGTPVIVTDGGATDAFCPAHVALRVPGRAGARVESGAVARFIEPDLAAVMDAIDAVAAGNALDHGAQTRARNELLRRFSWPAAARALAEITVGLPQPLALAG